MVKRRTNRGKFRNSLKAMKEWIRKVRCRKLDDLLAVRSALIGRRLPSDVPDLDEAVRVCDARDAAFLTYASRGRLDTGAVGVLLQDEDRWVLWHLDGRFAAS